MREDGIDILKVICSFLIVCIHIPFSGILGDYFTALTRVAVPIFFMITGYFYSDIIAKHKKKQQIKKIFLLVIKANILFFIWNIVLEILKRNDIVLYIQSVFTWKNVLNFLLLNESPLAGHLWYLGAILYVLIIVLIIDKLNCGTLLYILTPVLLLGDLALGKYSLLLWGKEYPYILVRNFLFVGIPYFCIGRLIRVYHRRTISRNVLIVSMVLFSLTSLLERFVLVSLNVNATRDHYISTTLLAITVFLFAIDGQKAIICRMSNKESKEHRLSDLMAGIGRKYSTWIYILHPIFITCIGIVMNKIGLYLIYRCVAPIMVYISTLLFLVFMNKLKNSLKL